ncbi:MAG TPA: group II intron maturase-specific domain-containing protein, partial [Terriglobia bacterium]|nr:group II intron maturase-specific domain-containing protein [Terriglobia bacterium]
FKDTIRAKTRRHNGQSLQTILTDLNWTLRGWFEYFQHRRRFVFITLDKWVRMRLRSLLRFRRKRKGRGRGSDHQRWPHAFFAKQGLFSLAEAHTLACQSSRR